MHIQLDTIRIGHPHRDLGTADVDLLGLFVVQIQIRFDGVPVVTCSLMSKETGMGRETRRRTGLWGAPLREAVAVWGDVIYPRRAPSGTCDVRTPVNRH